MISKRLGVQKTGKGIARGQGSLSRVSGYLIGIALVGLLVMASAPSSFADTVFSVTGTFANGAVFDPGSTITIDTTLGITTDSNLSISAVSNSSPANTFTAANIFQNGAFMTPFIWQLADGTELDFFMPVPPDFQGFTGGTISLVTYFQSPGWGFSGGSTDTVLTPVVAPEPAAISLLGIGLLGLMGLAFWRKRAGVAAAQGAVLQ